MRKKEARSTRGGPGFLRFIRHSAQAYFLPLRWAMALSAAAFSSGSSLPLPFLSNFCSIIASILPPLPAAVVLAGGVVGLPGVVGAAAALARSAFMAAVSSSLSLPSSSLSYFLIISGLGLMPSTGD